MQAVNLCGDADTVGSITAQVAGALYGAAAIPREWLQALNTWDKGRSPARVAPLICRHHCGQGLQAVQQAVPAGLHVPARSTARAPATAQVQTQPGLQLPAISPVVTI